MPQQILIAGGGIGGLTAAIALKRFDADVVVCERQASFAPAGAGITIQANAHAVLSALGVEIPAEDANPLEAFRMVNAKGRVLMCGDVRNVDIATPSINVHRADLHRALENAADDLGIPRQMGCEVVAVASDERAMTVTLSGGQQETCELLVGADGIHSCVRESLLGSVTRTLRSSEQTCWRFALTAPELTINETVEHWAAGRRVGVVPLTRGRYYVYLVMSDWWKPRLAREDTPEFLQREFGDMSEMLAAVLARVDAEVTLHSDDLVEQSEISFGHGRTVLIGDAAHAMTPNLGQGAGMAIEDAAALALLYAQSQPNVETLAEELSKQRLARVKKIQSTSWRIGNIAHAQNPLLRSVRDFFLGLMPTAMTEKQATALWSEGLELGELLRSKLEMQR